MNITINVCKGCTTGWLRKGSEKAVGDDCCCSTSDCSGKNLILWKKYCSCNLCLEEAAGNLRKGCRAAGRKD